MVTLKLTPLGKLLVKMNLPFHAFTFGGWNIEMLREYGLNPTYVTVGGEAISNGMMDLDTVSKKVLDGILIDNEDHPATPYDKLVRVNKNNYKLRVIKKLIKKKVKLYFDIDGTLIA